MERKSTKLKVNEKLVLKTVDLNQEFSSGQKLNV